MKELLAYLLSLAIFATIFQFAPPQPLTTTHPFLASHQAFLLFSGHLQHHPSFPLYQRIYLLSDSATIASSQHRPTRLFSKQEQMSGIIYTYDSLELTEQAMGEGFFDIGNMFRFMDKTLILPTGNEKCIGEKEKRANGQVYCQIEVNSMYLIEVARFNEGDDVKPLNFEPKHEQYQQQRKENEQTQPVIVNEYIEEGVIQEQTPETIVTDISNSQQTEQSNNQQATEESRVEEHSNQIVQEIKEPFIETQSQQIPTAEIIAEPTQFVQSAGSTDQPQQVVNPPEAEQLKQQSAQFAQTQQPSLIQELKGSQEQNKLPKQELIIEIEEVQSQKVEDQVQTQSIFNETVEETVAQINPLQSQQAPPQEQVKNQQKIQTIENKEEISVVVIEKQPEQQKQIEEFNEEPKPIEFIQEQQVVAQPQTEYIPEIEQVQQRQNETISAQPQTIDAIASESQQNQNAESANSISEVIQQPQPEVISQIQPQIVQEPQIEVVQEPAAAETNQQIQQVQTQPTQIVEQTVEQQSMEEKPVEAAEKEQKIETEPQIASQASQVHNDEQQSAQSVGSNDQPGSAESPPTELPKEILPATVMPNVVPLIPVSIAPEIVAPLTESTLSVAPTSLQNEVTQPTQKTIVDSAADEQGEFIVQNIQRQAKKKMEQIEESEAEVQKVQTIEQEQTIQASSAELIQTQAEVQNQSASINSQIEAAETKTKQDGAMEILLQSIQEQSVEEVISQQSHSPSQQQTEHPIQIQQQIKQEQQAAQDESASNVKEQRQQQQAQVQQIHVQSSEEHAKPQEIISVHQEEILIQQAETNINPIARQQESAEHKQENRTIYIQQINKMLSPREQPPIILTEIAPIIEALPLIQQILTIQTTAEPADQKNNDETQKDRQEQVVQSNQESTSPSIVNQQPQILAETEQPRPTVVAEQITAPTPVIQQQIQNIQDQIIQQQSPHQVLESHTTAEEVPAQIISNASEVLAETLQEKQVAQIINTVVETSQTIELAQVQQDHQNQSLEATPSEAAPQPQQITQSPQSAVMLEEQVKTQTLPIQLTPPPQQPKQQLLEAPKTEQKIPQPVEQIPPVPAKQQPSLLSRLGSLIGI